jgi:putative endonuclease
MLARLAYHNSGRQRSTKNRIPFVLVYPEQFVSRIEAEAREKQYEMFA